MRNLKILLALFAFIALSGGAFAFVSLGISQTEPKPATTDVEFTDPGIVYTGTWTDEAEGDGSKLSSIVGDSFSFTFTGTDISAVMQTRLQGATIDFTLDGGNPLTISTWDRGTSINGYTDTSTVNYKEFVLYTGLANTSHTLVGTITSVRDDDYLSDGTNPQLRLLGLRYGTFTYSKISGVVKDVLGNSITSDLSIDLKGKKKEGVFLGEDGRFTLSALPDGFYKAKFASNTGKYVTTYRDYDVIGNYEVEDVILPFDTAHDLYNKIVYPNEGTPAFIENDGNLVIEFIAAGEPESAMGEPTEWIVTIGTDTPAVTAEYQGNSLWHLTVPTVGIADGVYNLKVEYSGFAGNTKRKSVVLGEAGTDYTFVVVDSPESRYLPAWTATYFVDEAVTAINALDPQPDFVVILGDTIANPRTMANARTQLQAMVDWTQTINAPVIALPGNHDLGGFAVDTYYQLWSEIVGKRYFAFTYGNERLIFNGNGSFQTAKMEVFAPEQHTWYEDEINEWYGVKNLFSFRHARNVTTGYVYWPSFEQGKVAAALYGHYGVNEDISVGGTNYIQTADILDGWYRVVRIWNGAIASKQTYQAQ